MLEPAAHANETDEELARRAGARSEAGEAPPDAQEALAALYDRYAARLLGFMVNRLPRGEAEDAAQEVWRRVWSAAHKFDGENWRAWLFAIARNLVIDRARRTQAQQTAETGDELPDVQSRTPWEHLEEKERQAALRQCINQLPPEDAAFIRGRLAGRSYEQLCVELGWKSAKAYKRWHQLKDRLAQCVEQTLA